MFLPRIRTATPRCFARLSHGSAALLAKAPEDYKGVVTKYGWVLVRNAYCARGWTQTQLNLYLEQNSPEKGESVQSVVDQWMASADMGTKPIRKKPTAEDARKQEEMKLFLRQLKDEGPKKTARSPAPKQTACSTHVTFTYAWNYFMAMTYPKHKDLPPKEARQQVAAEWRQMSMDEKDVYREEYARLLRLGKDILHGKIVDRETKMKLTERLQTSKERSLRKKAEALRKLEQEMEDGLISDV